MSTQQIEIDCKPFKDSRAQPKIRDDPKTIERKKKVILFGKRIFFSNFVTASLIFFYIMLLYAMLSAEVDLHCGQKNLIAILIILGVSDLLMIGQHFISFFAMINHSEIGLIGCIIAHSISLVLKIVGGIMIIHYAGDQNRCQITAQRQVKAGFSALPFVAAAVELFYILIYTRLMKVWGIILSAKWRKQFTLVRKPLKLKHPINQPMNPQDQNN